MPKIEEKQKIVKELEQKLQNACLVVFTDYRGINVEEMIAQIKLPALVIHGRVDTLVPWREGELVYNTLGSVDKKMLVIPGAGHNDIIIRDIPKYFGAIEDLVSGENPTLP
jgi:esterase/lipase